MCKFQGGLLETEWQRRACPHMHNIYTPSLVQTYSCPMESAGEAFTNSLFETWLIIQRTESRIRHITHNDCCSPIASAQPLPLVATGDGPCMGFMLPNEGALAKVQTIDLAPPIPRPKWPNRPASWWVEDRIDTVPHVDAKWIECGDDARTNCRRRRYRRSCSHRAATDSR